MIPRKKVEQDYARKKDVKVEPEKRQKMKVKKEIIEVGTNYFQTQGTGIKKIESEEKRKKREKRIGGKIFLQK